MIGEVINKVMSFIPNAAMFPLFLAIALWFAYQAWTKKPTALKSTLAKVG